VHQKIASKTTCSNFMAIRPSAHFRHAHGLLAQQPTFRPSFRPVHASHLGSKPPTRQNNPRPFSLFFLRMRVWALSPIANAWPTKLAQPLLLPGLKIACSQPAAPGRRSEPSFIRRLADILGGTKTQRWPHCKP
jgi:hypothetical protein